MGAIVLDASKVNSYVLPNLLKSNNVMKTAYNTGQALKKSLPSSFAYKTTLNNIVEEIYNLRKEIKNIDSMIDKKIQRAKTIETKRDSKITRLAQSASKIGSVAGALVGGSIGASTGSIIRTAAGVSVGAAVGSFVGKALVNTGAKIASNVKSLCINLWDGAKELGKKIYDGCKTVVKKATSFVKEKALPFLKNVGEVCLKCTDWVITQRMRLKASIVNTTISLVEGIVSFAEAIMDALVVIGGAVVTLVPAAIDIVNGFKNGKMEWTNTKALWIDNYLPFISTDYTSKGFDKLYSTAPFKIIDNMSYGIFKRENGVVYEIGKGVGYYTGVIVATAFTGGTVGATTFATNFAVTAGVSGVAELGKATQNNYNNVIDKQTKKYFIQEIMNTNPNISAEEAEKYFNEAKENGLLTNYDSVRKGYQDNMSGGEVWKILGTSTGQAVVEGTVTAIIRTDFKKIAQAGASVGKVGSIVKNIQNFSILKSVGKSGKGLAGVGKAGTQAVKSYVKELASVISDGDYDLKKASIDAAAGAITEVANANIGLKNIKEAVKGKQIQNTNYVTKTLVSESAPNQFDASGLTGNVDNATEEVAEKAIQKTFKDVFKDGATAVKEKHIFGSIIPERMVKDSYKSVSKKGVVSPIVEGIYKLAA